MAFFQRVMNYVFNELLVNTLANSRSFQRFAIKTDAVLKDLAEKGATHKTTMQEQAQNFQKVFQQELRKGMEQQFKTPKKGP